MCANLHKITNFLRHKLCVMSLNIMSQFITNTSWKVAFSLKFKFSNGHTMVSRSMPCNNWFSLAYSILNEKPLGHDKLLNKNVGIKRAKHAKMFKKITSFIMFMTLCTCPSLSVSNVKASNFQDRLHNNKKRHIVSHMNLWKNDKRLSRGDQQQGECIICKA